MARPTFESVEAGWRKIVKATVARTVGTTCPNDIEDLTQDVMLRLWHNFDRIEFTSRGRVLSYVCTAARNFAYDHLKNQRRIRWDAGLRFDVVPAIDGADSENEAPFSEALVDRRAEAPDARLVLHEREDEIRRIIAVCPPASRPLAEMSVFHGLGEGKIAAATGVALGTVKSRLHRARAVLREQVTAA